MSVTATANGARNPHEGTVLTLLRDLGPTSRAGLAELTGLSATTVSKAVGPLVERGLLRESTQRPQGVGRPAVALIPVPEAVTVCGVQIRPGQMQLGLADAAYRVRRVETFDFDTCDDPAAVIAAASGRIRAMVAADGGAPCVGVGVGVPAPVDANRRRLAVSIPLAWHGGLQDRWRQAPVADYFEQHLGLPTVVEHNVRSLALAECRFHNHQAETLVYVNIESGVGIAVSVNGTVFHSGRGETYLGHTRVHENGQRCRCGSTGCLETIVGEPYLRQRLDDIAGTSALLSGNTVMEDLRDLVAAGSPQAIAIEDDIVTHLASALATVVNLFTPDVVLVGGILGSATDALLGSLREQVRSRIFPPLRATFRLDRGDVSPQAPVRAGAAVALERLHFG